MKNSIIKSYNKASRLIKKEITSIVIVFFLLFILINYFSSVIFFYRFPFMKTIIILSILSFPFLIICLLTIRFLNRKYLKEKTEIVEEINFLNLISENTREMMILLDNLGRIINHNQALIVLLNLKEKNVRGKPLRDLFNFENCHDSLLFKRVVLANLNEALQSRETEFIIPVKSDETDEYKSILLKLIPLPGDNELRGILGIGRVLGSDYITNKWLKEEKSFFIMDTNIPLLHIFCHRLTRNLDGKLNHNQIILIQIALQEILLNAVEHGNLGIDYNMKTEMKNKNMNYLELLKKTGNDDNRKNRKVFVNYVLDNEKVLYVVRDEGKGFKWESYMNGSKEMFNENLTTSFHGVGLQMVKNSFDIIKFNSAGNEVQMIKYFNDR
jgi:two-component system, sensor histidine kinase LadS